MNDHEEHDWMWTEVIFSADNDRLMQTRACLVCDEVEVRFIKVLQDWREPGPEVLVLR